MENSDNSNLLLNQIKRFIEIDTVRAVERILGHDIQIRLIDGILKQIDAEVLRKVNSKDLESDLLRALESLDDVITGYVDENTRRVIVSSGNIRSLIEKVYRAASVFLPFLIYNRGAREQEANNFQAWANDYIAVQMQKYSESILEALKADRIRIEELSLRTREQLEKFSERSSFESRQFTELRERLKSYLEQSRIDVEQISQLKTEVESMKENFTVSMDKFGKDYREIINYADILKNSVEFKDDSITYLRTARSWRWIVLLTLCIVLFAAVWILCLCIDDITCLIGPSTDVNSKVALHLLYISVFSKIAVKAFILTILIMVLKFTLRHYDALMHNMVIANTKYSSLRAILRILGVVSDKGSRDEFLLSATKELFVTENSGFLRKSKDKRIDKNLMSLLREIKNLFGSKE